MTRLRYAEQRPLAIMQNWLPPAYADINTDELTIGGLYEALRERGAKPAVAQQSIGARMPTPTERKQLEMKASQPLLR